MIQVSEISKTVQPSLTRALFNMAKEYSDVIDFTLGDFSEKEMLSTL